MRKTQFAIFNVQFEIALAYILIGLVALLPRILDLGGFITLDEANFWIARSQIFLQAVRNGDFAATAISTHPGVTTMWLGAAGFMLRDFLWDNGIVQDGSYAMGLVLLRLPGAIVHTASVLIGYALLRRMLAPAVALVAAILWATDPFLVAYSRLLHVDGLLATFAALCILAAAFYWHHGRSKRALALSGICGGLALLSKSPALILFPAIGILAVLEGWRAYQECSPEEDIHPIQALLAIMRPLALWVLIMALTAFVLWPALWVGPVRAYEQLRLGVEAEGAQPHIQGNFFLGQRDDSPGVLFYPVVIALRLTPWTLLGVVLLPLAWWNAGSANRRDMVALACFVILLTLGLSVFPKKFNRYLVPVFPALDILAAIGLASLQTLLVRLAHSRPPVIAALLAGSRWSIARSLPVLIVLAAILNIAGWHPYSIAAFNQALGGAQAGAWAFTAGWGEGYEQVAGWLNQQPDITGVTTVSRFPIALGPYLKPGSRSSPPRAGKLPAETGYVVVYIEQVQPGQPSTPFSQFYGKRAPLHTVSIHGVDYAWIYQAPPSVAQVRPAEFGPQIRLIGVTSGTPQRGKPFGNTLLWEVASAPAADYTLFAHLIGADGRRYAQVDLPYSTAAWRPGRFEKTDLPIVLPADLPSGNYRLVIGFYDPASGQRLPLAGTPAADSAIAGPHALTLTEFQILPGP